METLIYNSTSFLRVTLGQCSKAYGLPATKVALLVPGVNTPPYNHRFKSLVYTKTFVKWIIPNLYHLLIYSSSLFVQFYVSNFLNYETFNFWEVLNFSPSWGFLANNFISRNDTLFIFSDS